MPKFEIPDPQKSNGLVKVRGTLYARFYLDGVEKRKSLGTDCYGKAAKKQAAFYEGGTIYRGRAVEDKLKDKPDLYVYYQQPFLVQIKGHVVGRYATKQEAIIERDHYLATL